jgi:indole-3-glycerol phosphate synthase
MSILNEIVAHKKQVVEERKALYPEKLLEKSIFYEARPISLKKYIQRKDKSGIIAEFKRKSPSKGWINQYADIENTSLRYMMAGASALSVLTDEKYFGGSNKDLETARQFNYCPILRKDFIIDPYQIIEAKSIGADAVLLIAAILSKGEVKKFATQAKALGMEVLFEVHTREELDKLDDSIELVGVNNRDLKDFSVDYRRSIEIGKDIPSGKIKVAESGISNAETIEELRRHGFEGFLIGEAFMKHSRPAEICAEFIRQLSGKHEQA